MLHSLHLKASFRASATIEWLANSFSKVLGTSRILQKSLVGQEERTLGTLCRIAKVLKDRAASVRHSLYFQEASKSFVQHEP